MNKIPILLSTEYNEGLPGLSLLNFTLPSELEASEPPEARGLSRDEVRLMVSYIATDQVMHTRFRQIGDFLKPGDVLVKLCKPFHVPPEFIMRINGLKSARSIRPRQELKLVQGPFDVLAENPIIKGCTREKEC